MKKKSFITIVILILLTNISFGQTSNLKISLAEWSLHKTLRAGEITNLDFPGIAKSKYNLDAVEYVSQFFKDKAEDTIYLTKLKNECEKYGVKSLLIMIDGEGALADSSTDVREEAIANHYKWVKAASFLGCHSIRVNLQGKGSIDECKKAAIQSLTKLAEFASPYKINIIVENHGGYSSNGLWLSEIMKTINKSNCGTLPDFGNFYEYDRYKGVEDLMPFAKGVSAKSYDFDENGNETTIDYERMLKIVAASNYSGYIDVEYEGKNLSEDEGIKATIKLLQKSIH